MALDLKSIKPRCCCLWLGERCRNDATAEDGLCNWCAPHSARTDAELSRDPRAITDAHGRVLGIGGGPPDNPQTHDSPLADKHDFTPKACWYAGSGRTVLHPNQQEAT
jgi:hypothetical protein